VDRALGAASPIHDLGFVDFVSPGVGRGETRGNAHRAVHIDHAAADPADQMMVIVANAIFEARRRPGRLNPPNQALGSEQRERVVHRLKGDGSDLGPDDLRDPVRGDVGLPGNGSQHRQPLRGHLDAALSKEIARVNYHPDRLDQILERFQCLGT